MAAIIYGATALNGGASGALDDGATAYGDQITNGSLAIVQDDDKIYFFEADTSSGASENAPEIITPDDHSDGSTYTGSTRWLLMNVVQERKVFIPVADFIDNATAPTAPAAIGVTEGATGAIKSRDFDDAADEGNNIIWQVPANCYVSRGIKFRVLCVVTNATGPSSEGLAFGLSGLSLTSGDIISGTAGTVVVTTAASATHVQNDLWYTTWSDKVTVTGLTAGELAMLTLIRDISDATDDYAQDIGVCGIELLYFG